MKERKRHDPSRTIQYPLHMLHTYKHSYETTTVNTNNLDTFDFGVQEKEEEEQRTFNYFFLLLHEQ